MSLKNIAQETLQILNSGSYTNSEGATVDFLPQQQAAVNGTVLYTPAQADNLLGYPDSCAGSSPAIEVTDETTQVAAKRLAQAEGRSDVVLLNYASARNPGGGFINGAKAQEEDLVRCSGLYPCLLTQPAYYEYNRRQKSLLYSDHIIYAPNVPWFRTHSQDLLAQIFLASVITAPAPNAGEVLRRDANAWPEIEATLRHRAGLVLAIARDKGHRTLLLGAWGCGVFRNQPAMVADAFGTWLTSPEFTGCFDRVVFAVYDPTKQQETLKAFQARF
ncbi:MAG: TIGR02452 family protein [Chloroflexota bacterium]